jgi:hypothetical protein
MRKLLYVGLMVTLSVSAQAQAATRQLGQAGNWAVVEQVQTANSAPASCMIVEPVAAVAIRSVNQSVDLMVANAHWDLPKGMRGAIRVVIGTHAAAFPASSASANTAVAPIDPSVLPSLLNAMAQARSMTVLLFPDMPVLVRPDGFAAMLPAFKRCAGLR